MAKIKLTKNELKTQKESLQRYVRYLPTLQLKKQQLQAEIAKINKTVLQLQQDEKNLVTEIENWVDVFAQETGITDFFKFDHINVDEGNIAGIDIPVFKSVSYHEEEFDLMKTPFWVDKAIEESKKVIDLKAQQKVFQKQVEMLKEELRITNQRVNLFEKVKIPESKENIRKIRIFLGDMQTAAVVRGKIAKTKIEKKKQKEQNL